MQNSMFFFCLELMLNYLKKKKIPEER